ISFQSPRIRQVPFVIEDQAHQMVDPSVFLVPITVNDQLIRKASVGHGVTRELQLDGEMKARQHKVNAGGAACILASHRFGAYIVEEDPKKPTNEILSIILVL